MGILSLLGQKTRVQFIVAGSASSPQKTVLTFDCSISETHSRKSTATRYEVESGQSISDHIIVEPFSLDIQAMISDTPLNLNQLGLSALTTVASAVLPPAGIIGAAAGYSLFSALSGNTSPSVAAYNALLQLQANKQPFDVLTSLQRYPSMWIDSLSVPRNASDGKVLLVNISLVQLLIVSAQTVDIQILNNPSVSSAQSDTGTSQLGNSGVQNYINGLASGLAKTGG
jgi:hypothetical protein